ncbi:MAG: hypothetical protein DWQ36_01460 [Acidobacteria bacterium]|nr:MAG: hypothetical protein DWQ30_14250 [Acidobacteriota bacterium]REK11679.1 MAG: hypothetical protein DWQ36_01460 [Acidobacteriota bacterium]
MSHHPTAENLRSAAPPRRRPVAAASPLVDTAAMLLALTLALAPAVRSQGVPAEALELRNLGIAQLENEKPEEAEETFRRITRLVPRDPLGPANLAIALHRQQQTEGALAMITAARELAPRRADLLMIESEIHGWGTLDTDKALALAQQAMTLAPTDPEVVYAVYRQAEASRDEAARAIATEALGQLALLRPDNLVVLLRSGVDAIESGDRRAATAAWLRVRELLWQPQERLRDVAEREIAKVLDALEENQVAQARVPAIRLENLMKSTPTYRSSLVELFTDVRGLPVWRFEREPEGTFGDGIAVAFEAAVVDPAPAVGPGLVVADLDGDQVPDLARLVRGASGGTQLELRLSGREAPMRLPAAGSSTAARLLAVDLDNSGTLELIAYSDGPATLWQGGEAGALRAPAGGLGVAGLPIAALAAFDFDSEGDLDLVTAQGGKLVFLRNNLQEDLVPVDLETVEAATFPQLGTQFHAGLRAVDLDRDEDQDLIAWGAGGLRWLDNLRQGQFRDRTTNGGLSNLGAVTVVATADLSGDGLPDLALATGEGLLLLENRGGGFAAPSSLPTPPSVRGPLEQVVALDADNDGRLDLATCGAAGVTVLLQRDDRWQAAATRGLPAGACRAIDADDLDGDGDLDLVASGAAGLVQLTNQGGNRNGWLRVSLRGLTKGNDKNNFFGRGATVEVRAGSGYQYREVDRQTTHFGLGGRRRADNLRVVWANGVPQNRIHPQGEQTIVEEQQLKGSCPFLYTWNGERIEFVTDLLWNAPLGMPVAPGVWAASDPRELVRIDGAVPRPTGTGSGAEIDLRITEELWEAAYFDRTRLWVVDHPEGTELTSSLRVFARIPEGFRFDEPRVIRAPRPVAAAWDGDGREVTARVAARDEVYADGYPVGDYQGVTPLPWALTFDLGEAPAAPIRLVLDGWIFPADASLNLAVAQRNDLGHHPLTALEMLTDEGWATLLDPMGFPAGKTKTMVVDVPELPPGVSKLRVRTSRWLHWDRIAWTPLGRQVDAEAVVVARRAPDRAELRYRGFSRMYREAPNAPHRYLYDEVTTDSPWQPAGGRYTGYGDVLDLLTEVDDRLVVMAPGDEIALSFAVGALPAPAAGMQRTYLLESWGWDKDFDRNTWEATSAQPLPFSGMDGYPFSSPRRESAAEHAERHRRLTRAGVAESGSDR